MLQLHNLTVKYNDIPVLNDVSATVQSGDCITIVGHNGAGKSTLLHAIAGNIVPYAGKIMLDGKDITPLSERQRAPLISMVQQKVSAGSIADMTVEQNLSLALYKEQRVSLKPGLPAKMDAGVQKLLDQLLPGVDIKKVRMSQLSGGQQQMVAFIMATVGNVRILLLDEPTAALDPKAAKRLFDGMRAFWAKQQLITLLITHNLSDAIHFGNKLWIMRNGNIIKEFGVEKKQLQEQQLREML